MRIVTYVIPSFIHSRPLLLLFVLSYNVHGHTFFVVIDGEVLQIETHPTLASLDSFLSFVCGNSYACQEYGFYFSFSFFLLMKEAFALERTENKAPTKGASDI